MAASPQSWGLSVCTQEESPHLRGADTGWNGMAYQPLLLLGLFLFGLAAGDDDRGSAQDEHDTGHVEDRGTDAAGGGERSTGLVLNCNVPNFIIKILTCTVLLLIPWFPREKISIPQRFRRFERQV